MRGLEQYIYEVMRLKGQWWQTMLLGSKSPVNPVTLPLAKSHTIRVRYQVQGESAFADYITEQKWQLFKNCICIRYIKVWLRKEKALNTNCRDFPLKISKRWRHKLVPKTVFRFKESNTLQKPWCISTLLTFSLVEAKSHLTQCVWQLKTD